MTVSSSQIITCSLSTPPLSLQLIGRPLRMGCRMSAGAGRPEEERKRWRFLRSFYPPLSRLYYFALTLPLGTSGSNGHCQEPRLLTTTSLIATESAFSSGALHPAPTPSVRKIPQTSVHCRYHMCAKISGYTEPMSWHAAPKIMSTLAG